LQVYNFQNKIDLISTNIHLNESQPILRILARHEAGYIKKHYWCLRTNEIIRKKPAETFQFFQWLSFHYERFSPWKAGVFLLYYGRNLSYLFFLLVKLNGVKLSIETSTQRETFIAGIQSRRTLRGVGHHQKGCFRRLWFVRNEWGANRSIYPAES